MYLLKMEPLTEIESVTSLYHRDILPLNYRGKDVLYYLSYESKFI